MCMALMLSLPILTWLRFFGWLVIGMAIYFFYSMRHSRLQHGVDVGPTEDTFRRSSSRIKVNVASLWRAPC